MAYIYSTGEILWCKNAIKFSINKSTKPVFSLFSILWYYDFKWTSRKCQTPLDHDGSTVDFLLSRAMAIPGGQKYGIKWPSVHNAYLKYLWRNSQLTVALSLPTSWSARRIPCILFFAGHITFIIAEAITWNTVTYHQLHQLWKPCAGQVHSSCCHRQTTSMANISCALPHSSAKSLTS